RTLQVRAVSTCRLYYYVQCVCASLGTFLASSGVLKSVADLGRVSASVRPRCLDSAVSVSSPLRHDSAPRRTHGPMPWKRHRPRSPPRLRGPSMSGAAAPSRPTLGLSAAGSSPFGVSRRVAPERPSARRRGAVSRLRVSAGSVRTLSSRYEEENHDQP